MRRRNLDGLVAAAAPDLLQSRDRGWLVKRAEDSVLDCEVMVWKKLLDGRDDMLCPC